MSDPSTQPMSGSRRRLAALLFGAEDARSWIETRARGREFPNAGRWVERSQRMPQRAFIGSALRWAHVGTRLEVVLDRRPCNEIGTTALEELERLASYLVAGAGGARALLVRSAVPEGFSAGADLRELHASIVDRRSRGVSLPSQVHELRAFIDRIHRAYDAIDMVPIPSVAALHGVVFGGGLELALTCDTLVADKSARFAFPELRLGLVPGFGGVPRLARDVGNAVVRDLLLSGRSLRATRAHALGLVSQVVARGEAVAVARAVADQAARFDGHTAAVAKRFAKPLPRAALDREKAVFTRLFASPVVEESLRRFVESTDPMPYLPARAPHTKGTAHP